MEKDLQLQNNLPEPNLMDNLQHIYQDVLRGKDDKIVLYKYIIENRIDVWLEDPNNPEFATRFNWILSQLDALEVKITSKNIRYRCMDRYISKLFKYNWL